MPDRRRALTLSLVAAAVWSLLCGLLAAAGHQPTGPAPADDWYAVQAVLVWGVVPVQAWAAGRAAAAVAGVQGPARWDGALGLAAAVLCFVLVDLTAYGVAGFSGLGRALPLSAVAAGLSGLGLGAARLRSRGVGWARALTAAGVGLAVAAVVGGPVLR